jgi:hypothetical protein
VRDKHGDGCEGTTHITKFVKVIRIDLGHFGNECDRSEQDTVIAVG